MYGTVSAKPDIHTLSSMFMPRGLGSKVQLMQHMAPLLGPVYPVIMGVCENKTMIIR